LIAGEVVINRAFGATFDSMNGLITVIHLELYRGVIESNPVS
jgi:hypothetical protein